jgi:hypothetical protein
MRIKIYASLLLMCASMLSYAGGFSVPTYTLNNVSPAHSEVTSRIGGRTIFVNITNPSVNASALGIYFNSNPYNSIISLTGVGTIDGSAGIAQNYQENTELSLIFENGKVTKYKIIVTKDLPPTLGTIPDNNTNIYNLEVSTVPGAGGQTIPYSKCLVSYNKVTCSFPANLSVTALYFSGNGEDLNTTITGLSNAGLTSGANNYFKSSSLLGINDLTTITAKAPDGTTKNYSVSFVEDKSVNSNSILNFSSNDYITNYDNNLKTLNIFYNTNSPNTSNLFINIPDGASISVVGGNVGALVDGNPYQLPITLPSANFEVIVTSRDGASKRYTVLINNYATEPNLSSNGSLDINSFQIANSSGRKIENEFYFSFPNEYEPFITGTGIYTYISLTQNNSNVGLSIDGVYFDRYSYNTTVNWATGTHKIEVYTVTGTGNQVVKTYYVKTLVQPKKSEIVGTQNAEGLSTAKEITQFYIFKAGIQYNATLSGSTFSINLPSNFALDNLEASIHYSNMAVGSVPGVLFSNGGSFDYNFTNPVPVIIYAEDGTSLTYSLVVTNTAPAFKGNTKCELIYGQLNNNTYFELNGNLAYSTIVGNNIRLDVPFGTDITKIKLELYSSGSTINIANYGIYSYNVNDIYIDFTTPVTVTSIAADGINSKTYIISINSILPKNTNTEIYFSNVSNIVKVIKSGDSFTLLYKQGQDLTTCVPNFSIANTSTVSVSGVRQFSGYTPVNLSSPVIYTVEAQSGVMKNYTVSASIFTGNESSTNSSKTILEAYVANSAAVMPGFENEAEGRSMNGTIIGTNIYLTVTGNYTGSTFQSGFYGRWKDEYRLKNILVNGFPIENGVFDYAKPVKVTAVAQDNSTLDYYVFVTYTANGVAMMSTMLNQTIVGFDVPLQVTVTGIPLTINASVTSGLALEFSSSDVTVASISGTSILFLKAGVVTITALNAGNELYNSISASVVVEVVSVSDSITAINSELKIEKGEFLVYPNPSSGSFMIDAPTYKNAEIMSILGEVVQSVALIGKTPVNLTGKGFYLVRLYSNRDSKTIKVVVE